MRHPTSGLKLFNSLTNQVELFEPLDSDKHHVKMYVCGPTVYDDAHLGHARCYITWDVLYRFLRFLGYGVTYVRNVTDVDDKILNRARERGETPETIAATNYQSFMADMKALNVLPPAEEPRATQYIQAMLQGIEALIHKGAAYATPDGSVYFRVSAKADYGKLKFGTLDTAALQKHLDDLQAGARVEVGEQKESPLDFALWKAVPLTDPYGWESPWPSKEQKKGWGRPGWHMECSAMNHALLGDQIDIHAGGADLIFPHHENEIAQSEAWSGLAGDQPHNRFAKYWLHNGFVNVSGEKMSKSLGNFSSIKTLLARYDANTIRYFLLTNHYRMPVDFNEEALQAAENRMIKIRRIFREAAQKFNLPLQETIPAEALVSIEKGSNFIEALSQDLNTAKALSCFDQAINIYANAPNSEEAASAFKLVNGMANVLGFNCQHFLEQPTIELPVDAVKTLYEEITGKPTEPNAEPTLLLTNIINTRKEAKALKNWARADEIRGQLTQAGLQILDHKDGTCSIEKDGVELARA